MEHPTVTSVGVCDELADACGLDNQVNDLATQVHLLLFRPRLVFDESFLVHRVDDCVPPIQAIGCSLVYITSNLVEPLRFLFLETAKLKLVF